MTDKVVVEETTEYEIQPSHPTLADHKPECAIFDAYSDKGWVDPCDCDCGGRE
jgi:hypothetical protein